MQTWTGTAATLVKGIIRILGITNNHENLPQKIQPTRGRIIQVHAKVYYLYL